MALTLVYTGEHYVVDVLAGWAVAALAILVATAARPVGTVAGTGPSRTAPRRSHEHRALHPPARGTDRGPVARGLVGAAHAGPALAVTVLAGLLAVAQGLDAGPRRARGGGRARRPAVDRLEQRPRRPRPRPRGRTRRQAPGDGRGVRSALVRGALRRRRRRAASCCRSPAASPPGSCTSVCVAAAWAYNLGLKSTVWSWVPYAVAFGGLTVFVALADDAAPPWWWPVGAALLGVGAHLLNVLPDLDDDAATGVRGLPHRLGPRRHRAGRRGRARGRHRRRARRRRARRPGRGRWPPSSSWRSRWSWSRGARRRPFLAAVAIALVDAALLVVAR